MKILGIIGTSLGIIAAISGAYLQFSLIPAAITADRNIDRAIDSYGSMYFGSPQHHLDIAAMSAKTDFAIVVMGIGLLSFLLSIVPAIKKQKLAWIGVGIGIVTFFLGAAHGTHMFS